MLSFEEYLELIKQPRAPRNQWLYEPGLRLYVRISYPLFRPAGVDFDLASMEAEEPGRGALTRFLDRYEARHGFYVENCLNDRLVPYLLRRGYVRFSPPGNYDINLFRGRRPQAQLSSDLI